jgi:streptogramin lyase
VGRRLPFFPTSFDKISGVNGARLTTFASPGCGGHGGVFAPGGILWSTSLTENTVLRYDTNTKHRRLHPILSPHGLTRDSQGNIWVAQFDLNMVTKIMPHGTVFPGFPQRSGGASFDRRWR